MVLLLTEYYGSGAQQAGFMRVSLKADYSFSLTADKEKIFTGYRFTFTSAYYPDATHAYAMAIDGADQQHYLVSYDWTDSSNSPTLFPMKIFSDSPVPSGGTGYTGTDSIIYAVNPDSDNFPVKGYVVGKTMSIWAFNSCI